ncbi:hypothetical protein [Aliamphritea spongicola]|nr:hypothetical protein [Aliamphritea spongicola]
MPVTINEDTASTVTDILEENDIAVTTAQTELQLALAETAAKPLLPVQIRKKQKPLSQNAWLLKQSP